MKSIRASQYGWFRHATFVAVLVMPWVMVELVTAADSTRFNLATRLQTSVDELHSMIVPLPTASHVVLTRLSDDSFRATRKRLIKMVRGLKGNTQSSNIVRKLESTTTVKDLKSVIEPLVALRVSVNPESRVKVNYRRPQIELREGQSKQFLIEVENSAGITAPLNLSAIDLAGDPPAAAKWCTIEVFDSPNAPRKFSGAESEYKIMKITPHVVGLWEVRIVGDAGQGTQDLGFRATADVLLNIQPKTKTSDD